jgi:hypothetical protein
MGCLAYLFRNRPKPSRIASTSVQKMASPEGDSLTTMEGNSGVDLAPQQSSVPRWRRLFRGKPKEETHSHEDQSYRAKATLGILSDKQTDEVPGEISLRMVMR